MMSRRAFITLATLVAVSVAFLPLASGAAEIRDTVAHLELAPAFLDWSPVVEAAGIDLRVSGPNGFSYSQYFEAPTAPTFSIYDAEGTVLTDGTYKYELTVRPRLTDAERAQLMAERGGGRELPAIVQSGVFTIAGGTIVPPDRREVSPALGSGGGQLAGAPGGAAPNAAGGSERGVAPQTFVDIMDRVIQGSLCVGVDCPSSPNFGFDTVRLEENNLRIHFDDTSVSAGFPSNDWRLTANDSASGGASRFSIDDATAGRTVFNIEAGARSNALYVDSNGGIGVGTSAPLQNGVHVVKGDSPTLRLEQNGSSGFTPQTWDVAGNETNFFVRDVTNGSRLSFRIRPGAPESSIDISGDGDVGMGTSSPDASLHVKRTDGSAQILVQDTGSPATQRGLLYLRNNGGVSFVLRNDDISESWSIGQSSHDFVLNQQQNGGIELRLTPDGELTIEGTLNTGSSRTFKENIAPIDSTEALEKVLELPVASWTYLNDAAAHVGPMAEDFRSLFGLGSSERYLAPSDLAGVALAAIQGLHQQIEQRDQQIEQRDRQIEQLQERVDRLEKTVQAVADKH